MTFWWQADAVKGKKGVVVQLPHGEDRFPKAFRAVEVLATAANRRQQVNKQIVPKQLYNIVRMELSGDPVALPCRPAPPRNGETDEARADRLKKILDEEHLIILQQLELRQLQHVMQPPDGAKSPCFVFPAAEDRKLLDKVTTATAMEQQAAKWSKDYKGVPDNLERDVQKDAKFHRGAGWDLLSGTELAAAPVAFGMYGVPEAEASFNANKKDSQMKNPWLELTQSFLPDLFGNVVSPHARVGSIAYYNVDHIFPHSLGGATLPPNMLALSAWSNASKGPFIVNTCISVRVKLPNGTLDRHDLFPGADNLWARGNRVRHSFRWHHMVELWKLLVADGEKHLLAVRDGGKLMYKDKAAVSGILFQVFLRFINFALCFPVGGLLKGGTDMPLLLGDTIPRLLEQLQVVHPFVRGAKERFFRIVREEMTNYPMVISLNLAEVESAVGQDAAAAEAMAGLRADVERMQAAQAEAEAAQAESRLQAERAQEKLRKEAEDVQTRLQQQLAHSKAALDSAATAKAAADADATELRQKLAVAGAAAGPQYAALELRLRAGEAAAVEAQLRLEAAVRERDAALAATERQGWEMGAAMGHLRQQVAAKEAALAEEERQRALRPPPRGSVLTVVGRTPVFATEVLTVQLSHEELVRRARWFSVPRWPVYRSDATHRAITANDRMQPQGGAAGQQAQNIQQQEKLLLPNVVPMWQLPPPAVWRPLPSAPATTFRTNQVVPAPEPWARSDLGLNEVAVKGRPKGPLGCITCFSFIR